MMGNIRSKLFTNGNMDGVKDEDSFEVEGKPKFVPKTWVEDFHDLASVEQMQYVQLGKTDMMVSKLGFGGSAIGGIYTETDDKTSHAVVRLAISKGINYIDTAPWYGNGRAESVLGQALKNIPRQAYYLATKIGRYSPDIKEMFDFSAERVVQSVEESLSRLNLDYLDLVQVHDLEFAPNLDIIINETLPALQKLKESGKTRYIGITGYPLSTLKEVISRSTVKVDTILSYCRCTLFDNTLSDYIDYFKDNNLGIINAAVIGMGLLTNQGPPNWHPANNEIKTACAQAAKYCQERDVSISKLALHFSLNQQGPQTHLVSFSELNVAKSNIDTALNGLTDKEEIVLQEIIAKYFEPLTARHWEGVELKKYWTAIQKLKNNCRV